MNKSELIAHMALSADLSKPQATRALDAALTTIRLMIKKGDEVTIAGFGRFHSVQRDGREGRNPRTGKPINIPARMTPKFAPAAALKSALN